MVEKVSTTSSPRSIFFVGAPANDQLRKSWRPEFLEAPDATLSQRSQDTLWRRLPPANHNAKQIYENEIDRTLDDIALDASFSLWRSTTTPNNVDTPTKHDRSRLTDVGGDGDDDDGRDIITAESNAATPQLASFAFDMSSVLDLEDLSHMPITAINKDGSHHTNGKRQILYTTLAAVMHISEPKTVITKSSSSSSGGPSSVVLVVLTLGDHTRNGFALTVWGSHAHFIARKGVQRRDIVLIEDFVLHRPPQRQGQQHHDGEDTLAGTSRQGRTRMTVLYRLDRGCRADDALRPLLSGGDLPSLRVKQVRDWALTWVPSSDTQPAHTPEDTA